MPTAVAYRFPHQDDADRARDILDGLTKTHQADVRDVARIRWAEGVTAPEIDHGTSLTGVGALEGAFAGMVIGWLVLQPLLGAAIGAAAGAVVGSALDVGLDESFINEVRAHLEPGTSVLVALYPDVPSSAVINALTQAAITPDAITTELTTHQVHRLRSLFTRD